MTLAQAPLWISRLPELPGSWAFSYAWNPTCRPLCPSVLALHNFCPGTRLPQPNLPTRGEGLRKSRSDPAGLQPSRLRRRRVLLLENPSRLRPGRYFSKAYSRSLLAWPWNFTHPTSFRFSSCSPVGKDRRRKCKSESKRKQKGWKWRRLPLVLPDTLHLKLCEDKMHLLLLFCLFLRLSGERGPGLFTHGKLMGQEEVVGRGKRGLS